MRIPFVLKGPARSFVSLCLVASLTGFQMPSQTLIGPVLPARTERGHARSAPVALQPRGATAPVQASKETRSENEHAQAFPLHKAPLQVPLPASPPTRYVPGLEEPLVATGPATAEENAALDAALKQFHDAPAKAGQDGDFADYAKPISTFLDAHPLSPWRAALFTNLGLGYYHDGYFSRAFTFFEQAWRSGRDATSPQAHLMVDRAVGELAKMHARVGHGKELEALFADIGSRPLGGPATGLMDSARAGLAAFQADPAISFLCGPKALKNLLITLKASKRQIAIADEAESGPRGFSLTELSTLADKTGLHYALIHREPGQPNPVPSVVNWKVHHYAAITSRQEGRYQIVDMTFGSNGSAAVMTAKAIDAESSGYFLVPSKVADGQQTAWRSVRAHSEEARAVYGMGLAPYPWPGTCAACGTVGQGPGPVPNTQTPKLQMTIARGSPTVASLHLEDTPVGYRPQIGVPNLNTIAYNAREDLQPANLSFSNVSPKWSHFWMSYITYDPTGTNPVLERAAGGGGGYYYLGPYNNAEGTYVPETPDNSQMIRNPATGTPTSYTRSMPDGGKEIFGLSNGAKSYPALMFLTEVVDSRGNATTLHYDASFRITSITDAVGRSTTFTYGITNYPLLITKITDPFGRAAQMVYDTSARLSSITDPIGITSSFTYSASETTFITTLTTPYGTSHFSDALNPNDTPAKGSASLSLTLTDPLGYTDYLYFYQNASMPDSDPPATVPAGMPSIANKLLEWRNTYYWNKHAFAQGNVMTNGVVTYENFVNAALTHWFHTATGQHQTLDTSGQISSVKQPLENRVWYDYHNVYQGLWSGTLDQPTFTGRVLDDGTTQLSQATYPILSGQVVTTSPWPLTVTDPRGRETKYAYAANNIDLQSVEQKTSASAFTTIASYGSYTAQHEPLSYTGGDGQTWNFAYTATGQVQTITDPSKNVTTFSYDGDARLATIENANLKTALTLTYDAADRVRTRTDSEGYSLTYDYDNLDRVTKVTYPDGTTDLYDYSFQSGPHGGTASLELRKHTDRLGHITTYGYDADRRLTSVTEPVTSTTTRTTNFDYYEDGTLKDSTDANGNVTHWTIDIESRPISKTYAYGTANAQTESYTYEKSTSRLHSITDAMGQLKTFTYGLDDRITEIAYSGAVNPTPNVTFAYDPYFPRITSMTDGSGTTSYSYYPPAVLGALQLEKETTPFTNGTVAYSYDALGRPAARTVDTATETFAYDKLSRLISHGTALGTFNLAYLGQTEQLTSEKISTGTVGTSWVYDTNDNDRRIKNILNSGPTRSFNFTTTPEDQITQIQETAPLGSAWAPKTWTYGYDESYRLTTASSSAGSYVYGLDAVDNITSFKTPAATTAATYNDLNQILDFGSVAYVYDKNGNVLDDGARTYSWDGENRLLSITHKGQPALKSTFKYDGLGRRIAIDTTNGTTTETRYLWCGESLCQARTTTDVVSRRYFQEGEFLPLGGQGLYYSQDQLGSVRDVLATQNGSRLASFDTDAYGNTTQSSGSVSTDFRYAGLFYDQQDGLYLSHSRPYSAAISRWFSKDPVKELAGFNLYAYVGATPMSNVDPTGFWQVTISLGDGLGGLLTFGNNGGTGTGWRSWFNGQWNVGIYGGGGAGASALLDTRDTGCKNAGLEFSGQFSTVQKLLPIPKYPGQHGFGFEYGGEYNFTNGNARLEQSLWTPLGGSKGSLSSSGSDPQAINTDIDFVFGGGESTFIGGGGKYTFGSCTCPSAKQ